MGRCRRRGTRETRGKRDGLEQLGDIPALRHGA